MSVSREDAGVRHCAACCGDDVEAFGGAEVGVAGFVADGAERGGGEEARVLGIGGGAFGGLGGLLAGWCGLGGGWCIGG